MKYTWNFDEDTEWWNNNEYDTIEECINAAREEIINDENDIIYIGEIVPYEPEINADDVLEQLKDDAYNRCGETADTWLNYGEDEDYADDEEEELSCALTQTLKDWLKKHNLEPDFCEIKNVREYSLITGMEI